MPTTKAKKSPAPVPTKKTRNTLDPLPESRWVLVNLLNTYRVRHMDDPEFTRAKWAEKAGIQSATIISRLLSQKSISLDNAIRLANVLKVGIDSLIQEPERYMRENLGVSPEAVGRKSLNID